MNALSSMSSLARAYASRDELVKNSPKFVVEPSPVTSDIAERVARIVCSERAWTGACPKEYAATPTEIVLKRDIFNCRYTPLAACTTPSWTVNCWHRVSFDVCCAVHDRMCHYRTTHLDDTDFSADLIYASEALARVTCLRCTVINRRCVCTDIEHMAKFYFEAAECLAIARFE